MADPAGSGTLVRIGNVFGVLTAAHVLHALPRHGEVGLVRITNRPDRPQKVRIDMRQAETLMIGRPPFASSLGPDIGFLRLPEPLAGWLNATSIFFDLEKQQTDSLSAPELLPCYDAIIGVIAERTQKVLNTETDTLLIETYALFSAGTIIREYNAKGFDLLDFDISLAPAVKRPTSFGGMSGGGLWRMCLDAEHQQMLYRRLIGVVFYQSESLNGRRTLTCHGPQTIYADLLAQIRAKWPN